jgi:hypothetical protein
LIIGFTPAIVCDQLKFLFLKTDAYAEVRKANQEAASVMNMENLSILTELHTISITTNQTVPLMLLKSFCQGFKSLLFNYGDVSFTGLNALPYSNPNKRVLGCLEIAVLLID